MMSVVEIDVNKNSNLEHKNLKGYTKNLGKNAIRFVIVLMIAYKKKSIITLCCSLILISDVTSTTRTI